MANETIDVPKLREFINPEYLEPEKIRDLAIQFKAAKPYAHLEIPHFFNEDVLQKMLVELATQEFTHKESDLFSFNQTKDLESSDSKLLQEFRTFLATDFRVYMQALTGMTFTTEMDLAGTLYEDTDYLLVHDDQLDGRKIAFLIYLSTMLADQGGSLNLFDTKDAKPTQVVKKIIPQFNTLAFFAVTTESFHEVEEVYDDVQRIAIGGWYHG